MVETRVGNQNLPGPGNKIHLDCKAAVTSADRSPQRRVERTDPCQNRSHPLPAHQGEEAGSNQRNLWLKVTYGAQNRNTERRSV